MNVKMVMKKRESKAKKENERNGMKINN